MNTHSLIGIYNVNQAQDKDDDWVTPPEYGVCAFFNASDEPQIAVVNCLRKYAYPVVGYVVQGLDQGKCELFSPHTGEMVLRVAGMGSSVVSLSPLSSMGLLSTACLGLVDKLNGTKAIVETKQIVELQEGNYMYHCSLSHRSKQCGFWLKSMNPRKAEFIPRQVQLDDQALDEKKDWTWDRQTGILMVDMQSVALDISSVDNFSIDIYIDKITHLQTNNNGLQ